MGPMLGCGDRPCESCSARSSLSGVSLGSLSIDPTAIGKQVAGYVVPPVIAAVKGELPGFLASVQPVLLSQGQQLLKQLQPQLEGQAVQAANALRPMIDQQVGTIEKRLTALIDAKIHDVASGAEVTHLKRQAALALAIHAGVILLGTALIVRASRGR